MESSLVFKVILQIVSFKSIFFSRVEYSRVFKSIFESVIEICFHKNILQDCVLAGKAIDDGVVFLAKNCGGADSIPLSRWRYRFADYFIMCL